MSNITNTYFKISYTISFFNGTFLKIGNVGNERLGAGPRSGLAVHPHACGERRLPKQPRQDANGSSPRMWGTVPLERHPGPRARFIPTHVGNGWIAGPGGIRRPVHPHACGERAICTGSIHPQAGSSPRMWGTDAIAQRYAIAQRFIPTHVGNGFSISWPGGWQPVHPHACGERRAEMTAPPWATGSSPRMWGTGDHADLNTLIDRFIPTHVGNGFLANSSTSSRAVHPHACGERLCARTLPTLICGSSPRMWGTENHRSRSMGLARFIPTHVGNGSAPACFDPGRAVHPHACGERRRARRSADSMGGSSPRMWGTG